MEENKVEITEEEIEKLRSAAREKAMCATHEWKQKGGWVECRSCTFPHAIRVMGNQKLVGVDERGMPILVSRHLAS